jgi:hypothetical protein
MALPKGQGYSYIAMTHRVPQGDTAGSSQLQLAASACQRVLAHGGIWHFIGGHLLQLRLLCAHKN